MRYSVVNATPVSVLPVGDKSQEREGGRDQIRLFPSFPIRKNILVPIHHTTHQQREEEEAEEEEDKNDYCQERKVHTRSHGSYHHPERIILTHSSLLLFLFYFLPFLSNSHHSYRSIEALSCLSMATTLRAQSCSSSKWMLPSHTASHSTLYSRAMFATSRQNIIVNHTRTIPERLCAPPCPRQPLSVVERIFCVQRYQSRRAFTTAQSTTGPTVGSGM